MMKYLLGLMFVATTLSAPCFAETRAMSPLRAMQGRQDKRAAAPDPDIKNEKYGTHERNVIDLWKAKSDKPTPLVVFIHGGGFRAGSKEQVNAAMIKRLNDLGITVAAINYRLSQHAIFPAPFHDSARAIQYMRSKAKDWNLDPAHIGATGGSAGAGISMWLAFHDDLADAKSEDPVLRESSRVQCVVSLQGQCSYDPRWIKANVGGKAHEHPALHQLFGIKADEIESDKHAKIFDEGSPITHLTKDDAPVYLSYSGNDKPSDKPGAGIHSEKFGEVLKLAMEKLSIPCELKVGRDSDTAQTEFFVKHLKK